MTYLFLKTFIIGPILHVLFRPWSKGSENVPKSGGAILASNHLSFSDSIFLPLKCSRPVTFLALIRGSGAVSFEEFVEFHCEPASWLLSEQLLPEYQFDQPTVPRRVKRFPRIIKNMLRLSCIDLGHSIGDLLRRWADIEPSNGFFDLGDHQL
jgi:hypothetical protein